jgi:hypothetical protein
MSRHVLSILTITATLLAVIAACGDDDSSSGANATACIELAKKCTRDAECCSGTKCMWQGDGAYCQSNVAQEPACSKGTQGCTQDRHCCSGSCNSGSCTLSDAEKSSSSSSGGNPACNADGAECSAPSACCSRNCQVDGPTQKSICIALPPNPRGGCGKLGDTCSLPAQCCSNNCLVGRCQN